MKGLKKYIIWTVLTFCIVLGMSIPMKTHAVTSGDYSYTYVYEYREVVNEEGVCPEFPPIDPEPDPPIGDDEEIIVDPNVDPDPEEKPDPDRKVRGICITRYYGSEAIVNIPSTIDGYQVVAIDFVVPKEFVTELTIPEGVTSLGEEIFHGFTGLRKITVDKDNKNYSSVDGVLFDKEQSTLIFFPEGKGDAFHIPEKVQVISLGAFRNAANLEEIRIPGTIHTIGERAFEECANLQKVYLEDGINEIDGYAFLNCKSLKSIELPETVYEIGYAAFRGCSSLEDIHLKEGLGIIESGAFEECVSLESIELPESLWYIGQSAFDGCSSLNDIKIPKNVSSLGEAFDNCENLLSFTIDEDNPYYSFENGVLFNKEKTVLYCYEYIPVPERKSYTVPETVVEIDEFAFSYSENLETVILPDELIKIGRSAFRNCSNLKTIEIPKNLENLESYAFYNCTSLKEILIPGGVETISSSAFENCTSLEKVSISDGVKTIDSGAFMECSNLQELIIPATVESMESMSFYYCDNLKMAVIPESVKDVSPYVFNYYFDDSDNLIVYGFEDSEAYHQLSGNVHFQVLEPERYTVSFDVNNGNETIYDISVTKYSSYGKLPVPTRDGYVFDGWYTAKNGGEEIDADTTVRLEENQILYAHWVKEASCTISFDVNGGFGSFENKTVNYGDPYGELPVPENKYGTFEGWYTKASGGTQIEAEDLVRLNGDQTLYAHWYFEKDWIFYKSDGNTVGRKIVSSGDTYGLFPIIKKEGYVLNGWYTASTGNEKITEETRVDLSIKTLYARWISSAVEVTFDSNYDGSNAEKRTVNYEHTYGVLPVPQRAGYLFTGWYTKPEGGEQIFADTKVNTLESHTLYARWILEEEGIVITFDACGGICESRTKDVKPEDSYGTLPTADRTGYVFKGWFTASTGGTKITENSVVSITKNHTLYAQWEAMKYTVYFNVNSNDGVVSITNKQVTYDDVYGTLPTATRTGYTFKGWYTSAENGEVISDKSKVEIPKDHTLYAYWEKNVVTPTHNMLNYSFSNSQKGFGYPDGYKIPYERYVTIYGDSAQIYNFWKGEDPWGGSCYGMCATSGLFFQEGNEVRLKEFNSEANALSDLKISDYQEEWELSLVSFIESMQVAQYCSWIQKELVGTMNNLESLCKEVSNFQQTGNNPVIVCIYGKEGGHAVVGYKLTSVSEKESRLYIYDPNFPNTERYITLYKNSSGKYTGWYYYMNNAWHWGSNYPNGLICYTTYDTNNLLWSVRATNRDYLFFSTNTENAAIYNSDGEQVVNIKDGDFYITGEQIYEIKSYEILADDSSSSSNTMGLWMPRDLYTVKNLDSGETALEVVLSDYDQIASVTTAAEEVVLMVDDEEATNYVQIPEENKAYDITLSSSLEGTFADVKMSGKTRNSGAVFSQINGIMRIVDDIKEFEDSNEIFINDMQMSVTGNQAENLEITTTISNVIPVEEILMNQSELTLKTGETKQCEITILPAIATRTEVVWESSDPSIVTVSDTGVITAVESGEATIYARTDNICAVCTVTVEAGEPVDPPVEPPVDPVDPPVEEKDEVARISGTTRYETGYKVADALKETLGIEKFEAVVVATGKNFADALAGSYLAAEKNAPIILTNGKDDNIATLHTYIKDNVAAGGTVYILGGEGAVPEAVEAIDGYDVARLAGKSRYETNLAILEEAGVSGDSIIVATGKSFADSLSASAAKLPILLVKPGAALTEEAKVIVKDMKNIYIIGGDGAVSAQIADELTAFGTVTRISGKSRYETSVAVAENFFGSVDKAVVASGKNFPDGLCGGPLAAAMNAPLILTADGKIEAAADYMAANTVESGYVLGGSGALADESVVNVFALESAAEIIKK